MKRLLATAALASALAGCATSGTAPAASTGATAKSPYESEILATVDRFLLAIGNHDDEALEEILITEGVSWIQTIKPGEEQPVRPYTNASMMEPDPDADLVFCYGANLGWDPAEALAPLGDKAQSFDDLAGLVAAVTAAAQAGDQILVMSNGGFGGVHGKLLAALAERQGAAG